MKSIRTRPVHNPPSTFYVSMHAFARTLLLLTWFFPLWGHAVLMRCSPPDMIGGGPAPAPLPRWYEPIPDLRQGAENESGSLMPAPVPMSSTNQGPSIFTTAQSSRLMLAWGDPLPVPSVGDNSMPAPGQESFVGPVVSLSPTVVDDTYQGLVTLIITGLAADQRMILEKYRVFNPTVGIEANSILMDSYVIQEGYLPLVGQAFNFNIPGDSDDATDTMKVRLNLYEPDISSTVGDYVYRIKSPTGAYPPEDRSFRVNAQPSNQSFFGLVKDPGGNPISNAFVAVLNPTGQDNTFVYGETSDSFGSYTLYTAPYEEYDLVATAPGYVGPYGRNVAHTILDGVSVNHDIVLTPGTRTIHGRVYDRQNPGLGLPGVEVILLSVNAENEIDQNYFTAVWSDENGDFEADVIEGRWIAIVRQNTVYSRGYMGTGAVLDRYPVADTTTGNVTNFTVGLLRSESILHGRLTSSKRDSEGDIVPLRGITISALRESDGATAHGVTDGGGDYRIALAEGRWSVFAMPNLLAGVKHAPSYPRSIKIGSEPSSLEYNFTARPIDAFVTGFCTDENDQPVPRLFLRPVLLSGAENTEFGLRNTDETDGFFSFGLAAGTWLIMPDALEAAQKQLLFEDLPEVTVAPKPESAAPPEIDANIKITTPTGNIILTVVDATLTPVEGVLVHGRMTSGGVQYNSFGRSDDAGDAFISVVDGDWDIDLNGFDLGVRGYSEVPRFSVTASGLMTTQLVSLAEFSNDSPDLVPEVSPSEGAVTWQGAGSPGRRYVIEGSDDLLRWRELGRVEALGGNFSLLSDEQTQELGRFFLRTRMEP